MDSTINEFFKGIHFDQKIVLSIDLDNTLVNREKGDNYVYGQTLEILKKLISDQKFYLVINTGRDLIGLSSFSRGVVPVRDAVLGSGSLVMADGEIYFNDNARIPNAILKIFLNAVESGILPFVDFYCDRGRVIFYNQEGRNHKDLFYSQNPRSWFNDELPPQYDIEEIGNHMPSNVFRIEIPIFKSHQELYELLINKKDDSINILSELLKSGAIKSPQFTLKRKVFFNKKYQDQLIFGRYEYGEEYINKGKGILNWLEKRNINPDEVNVIHIGDKDKGIVNDAIIKKMLPSSLVVMVGDKCAFDNKDIDLYLRGNVDEELFKFLEKF